jgi:hypothetical protein
MTRYGVGEDRCLGSARVLQPNAAATLCEAQQRKLHCLKHGRASARVSIRPRRRTRVGMRERGHSLARTGPARWVRVPSSRNFLSKMVDSWVSNTRCTNEGWFSGDALAYSHSAS